MTDKNSIVNVTTGEFADGSLSRRLSEVILNGAHLEDVAAINNLDEHICFQALQQYCQVSNPYLYDSLISTSFPESNCPSESLLQANKAGFLLDNTSVKRSERICSHGFSHQESTQLLRFPRSRLDLLTAEIDRSTSDLE